MPVTLALGYATEGFSLIPRKLDLDAMAKARSNYECVWFGGFGLSL